MPIPSLEFNPSRERMGSEVVLPANENALIADLIVEVEEPR